MIGSLDLRQALGVGEVVYEPGLLAAAHRGILYVDEVNLLHDHLVDLLLDAAAMGRSTVERDGVSVAHAARLILIGTMNPEEGELRPQLLDRFGLTVEITAPRDPELRAEVVRRRMAFDRDPASFVAAYAADEQALRIRIATARALLPSVRLDDQKLATIARVCAAFDVDGMRADIVTARAAAAHAAWHGRRDITTSDIRAAARLALPHRRRRNPFDAPGLDEDLLDQLLDEEPDPEPTPPDGSPTRRLLDPIQSPTTGSPSVPMAVRQDSERRDSELQPVDGHSTRSAAQRQARPPRGIVSRRRHLPHAVVHRVWDRRRRGGPPQPRPHLGRAYGRRDRGQSRQRPAAPHSNHPRGRAAPGKSAVACRTSGSGWPPRTCASR